jgi:hypothetical protein
VGEDHYGEERGESAEDKAERLREAGLEEAGWKGTDLALGREGDPAKIAPARRLRRQTTPPLKGIWHRLAMGFWKAVHRRLYEQERAKCCHARN